MANPGTNPLPPDFYVSNGLYKVLHPTLQYIFSDNHVIG
jgi:hypothetical protein